LAEPVDAVQDDVSDRGPDEGLAVCVVIRQIALDRRLKRRHAVDVARRNRFVVMVAKNRSI
jgi:hypothetical protein